MNEPASSAGSRRGIQIFLIGHFFQTGPPVHEMIVTQCGWVYREKSNTLPARPRNRGGAPHCERA